MSGLHDRSVLAGLMLAATTVLCAPSSSQAQESNYTTVTGRLHPQVEVQVQLDAESHGDRWFQGGVTSASVAVPPVNVVSCTMIAVPELSPDSGGQPMVRLRAVRRLRVRRGENDTWTVLELKPLLEAEPEACGDA